MKLFYRYLLPFFTIIIFFTAPVDAQVTSRSKMIKSVYSSIKDGKAELLKNKAIKPLFQNVSTSSSAGVIFSEDFDGIGGQTSGGAGTYVFPSGWILRNVDNRTPAASVSYVNEAWERREDFNFNVSDSAAFSTSYYSPVGASDDWMWTPLIGPLPSNCILKWNAVTYDPSYQDGYEVRIMTQTSAPGGPTGGTGVIGNQVTNSTLLFSTAAENTTWTPRSADLSAYAGESVWIAFRNNSNDKFLLLIDDVIVEEPVDFDAELISVLQLSEYTMLPRWQMHPVHLGAAVKNNGSNDIHNVQIQADVYQNGNLVHSDISGSVSAIKPDSVSQITLAPYTPTDTGIVEVKYEALSNEIDADTLNNYAVSPPVYISLNVFARDDGECIGSLGIGGGNGGELGMSYVMNKPGYLTGISVYMFNNYPTEPLFARIRRFENGIPGDSIAATESYYAPDKSGSWVHLKIHDGSVYMPADTFVITINEGDSTLSLGQSSAVFTNGTCWVNWPTSPFGTWANVEDFGAGFAKTLMVRPVIEEKSLSAPIIVDGIKDSFYTTLNGPVDGYLQLRNYAFNNMGRPAGDNDLSAKVWTAWDTTWFYLYEEVLDDTIAGNSSTYWQQDHLDLNFDPKPWMHMNSWKASLTPEISEPFWNGDSLNVFSDIDKQWRRRRMPGGYVLELAIKWSAMTYTDPEFAESFTPLVDSIFGFALVQYDNDGRGYCHAAVAWAADMQHTLINGIKYLGRVQFLDDHKLKFLPFNPISGDTNYIPYDGRDIEEPPASFITVDGVKDSFYTTLTGPDNGYLQIRSFAFSQIFSEPENDADLSAKVWTAWDSTWFYLYEEVTDDSLSGNSPFSSEIDALELNFDPQPEDIIQNSVFSTSLSADGSADLISGDSLNNINESDKQWIRKTIPGGYVLELALKWSAVKAGTDSIESIVPGADSLYGFALVQHDNDGSGLESSVMWSAVLHDSVRYLNAYLGKVKFLAGNKLQYISSNNVTGIINSIPYDGTDLVNSGNERKNLIPLEFGISQNYPNPFNPTTNFEVSVAEPGKVAIKVYDILGKEVASIWNEVKSPGIYKLSFNAEHLSSGVYFYLMKAGSFIQVKKMILMK